MSQMPPCWFIYCPKCGNTSTASEKGPWVCAEPKHLDGGKVSDHRGWSSKPALEIKRNPEYDLWKFMNARSVDSPKLTS